jgi:hypothetical protein
MRGPVRRRTSPLNTLAPTWPSLPRPHPTTSPLAVAWARGGGRFTLRLWRGAWRDVRAAGFDGARADGDREGVVGARGDGDDGAVGVV